MPLQPKSRDVNRHLEKLVRGLLAIDAAVVEEDDGLGPQRCGVEVVLTASKVQQHDAALHGLAVQCFEFPLASVNQRAAHTVRPQRRCAHPIGPQAVKPLTVAALHHQLAAAIDGHGHLKCLALHILQPQCLKPLAHVVAGLPLPRIPRHPRAKGRKARNLSGNVCLVNTGDQRAKLGGLHRIHHLRLYGRIGCPAEEIVYRSIDCARIAETDDRNHSGGEH